MDRLSNESHGPNKSQVQGERSGELIALKTERGNISCLLHLSELGTGGVIMVGGTDGGLDGPADGIYPTLAQDLLFYGITSLCLDFRGRVAPGIVEEGVYDVLQGVSFLKQRAVRDIALVGHSFGGAVVITAAALSPDVKAVVTLSSQSYGTRMVDKVSPRPILLIHGEDDQRLPPSCSEYVYARAGEPKELIILPGAKHSLRQRRKEIRRILVSWLAEKVGLLNITKDRRVGDG